MNMNLYLLRISLVAAAGGFLFGFDTSVISGVIEYIAAPRVFDLSAISKGWAVSCIIIGCMVGCIIAGPMSERAGRKWVLILTAFVFLASSIGCALATSYVTFVFYRIVAGIGVGAASMLAPIYIAEISPASQRGKYVSLNLVAIFLGQFAAFYSNYFLRNLGGIDNWRLMLGVMALPAGILFVCLFFSPESPRWLVERSQRQKALTILTRINGSTRAGNILTEIEATLRNEEKGEFSELFKGPLFRLLLVGIMLAVFQQVTGINVIMYYAPSIFLSAGFGADSALMQTAFIGLVNQTFAILAMFLVDKMGRRPLMIIGSIGMTISMGMLSLTFISGNQKGYGVLLCIMCYLAAFGFSLGPVVFVLLSEMFPNRLRGYAVAVATFMLWSSNFVVSMTFPYLLAHFKGYSFTVYGMLCLLCLVFVLKYVRETKEKTLEEIEKDFADRSLAI